MALINKTAARLGGLLLLCFGFLGSFFHRPREAESLLETFPDTYVGEVPSDRDVIIAGCDSYGDAYGYGQGYYYGYGQGYYYGYGQGYYQGSYRITISGNFGVTGNLSVTSNIGKGSGTFVIDHPLDPKNKLLFHSFVESPDVKNLYDGIITLDSRGEGVVELPSYFLALNKDFRYQLRPLSSPMQGLFVKEEVKDNSFAIAGGIPGGKVSWQVTGIRHDPYIIANPIVVEVEKGPDTTVAKGEYLHPELYSSSLFKNILGALKGIFGN